MDAMTVGMARPKGVNKLQVRVGKQRNGKPPLLIEIGRIFDRVGADGHEGDVKRIEPRKIILEFKEPVLATAAIKPAIEINDHIPTRRHKGKLCHTPVLIKQGKIIDLLPDLEPSWINRL